MLGSGPLAFMRLAVADVVELSRRHAALLVSCTVLLAVVSGIYTARHISIDTDEQKLISPRSPWQSPYVERLVGSMRRECLDRIIVFNERQLRTILDSYFAYYHKVRPHRGLSHDSPIPRPVESPERGNVIEMPLVGGLHHHYLRQAA